MIKEYTAIGWQKHAAIHLQNIPRRSILRIDGLGILKIDGLCCRAVSRIVGISIRCVSHDVKQVPAKLRCTQSAKLATLARCDRAGCSEYVLTPQITFYCRVGRALSGDLSEASQDGSPSHA